MSNTIYESGDDGLSGFSIADQGFGVYGVRITDPKWGAVTPEKLREAADAIEQHRGRGLADF